MADRKITFFAMAIGITGIVWYSLQKKKATTAEMEHTHKNLEDSEEVNRRFKSKHNSHLDKQSDVLWKRYGSTRGKILQQWKNKYALHNKNYNPLDIDRPIRAGKFLKQNNLIRDATHKFVAPTEYKKDHFNFFSTYSL